MSGLVEQLARLGLSQYLEAFVGEGFDTWETVLDITESDLSGIEGFKLQRAIAESRGQSTDRPLPIALEKATSIDGSYRSGDDSASETRIKPNETLAAGATTSTKRKYRRHPKPDEHAPERPPSAYVIFSNQVRETLRGQDLSFTEIAKVVGERWQVLPAEAREACERQANSAKEKYYTNLAEYKKTPQYDAYQKYLDEFKAKHAPPPKGEPISLAPDQLPIITDQEGKRSKVEPETRPTTRSSSHDQAERASGRRISMVQIDASAPQRKSEASPPTGPIRLPSGPTYTSKSTSPATHSLSGVNSPRLSGHYSPHSVSPRSATLNKEGSSDTHTSAIARDARGQFDMGYFHTSPAYGHSQTQPPSTTPPSGTYTSHYQASVDGLPRRSGREMTRLPPLTHEDTTLSSDSGQTGYVTSYLATSGLLPVLDAPKNMRILPAPIPSAGVGPSPLDRNPLSATSPQLLQQQQPAPQYQPDYRTSSSLAALLKASELARFADDEEMED